MASAEARVAILKGVAFIGKTGRAGNPLATQTGLKSNNFPNAKRRGLASILDRGIRRGDAVKNKEAMGEGAVTMKFYDENGAAIIGEDASLNIHDIVFTAMADGGFRLIDEAYLDEQVRLEEQKRDYVDLVTSKMVTDEVFIKTLGITEAHFILIAEAGGVGGIELGMPESLQKADGRPSVMEAYVGGSQLYMESLAKQRFIVRKWMPILQKKSETHTGDLDAKDPFTDVPYTAPPARALAAAKPGAE